MFQRLKDLWLEYRIDRVRIRIQFAKTRMEKNFAWVDMARLINQRSPAQVRRMEQYKNLL